MLDFEQLPYLFPELTVWGARTAVHSFVISHNSEIIDLPYRASYREIGMSPTNYLGYFGTKQEAMLACNNKALLA